MENISALPVSLLVCNKFFTLPGADGTVRIFMAKDATQVACLAGAHERGISDASWSPDSAYLATASDDKSIAIWSIDVVLKGNCSEPLKKLQGHTSYVYCCAFSPSGSLLASGGFDDCLKIWDLRKGRPFLEIAAHGDPVTSVCFSDDSSMVLTGSYDGLIRLWDAENGRCLKTLVDNDNPAVAWASFTPNSRYILVATLDSCLRLWCPTTGRCIRTFTTPGFSLKKFSCAAKISVQKDRLVLFAGSEDGFIYYWNLATKEFLGCTQVFSDSPVLALDLFETTLCCSGIDQNCSKIFIFTIQ